MKKKLLVLCLLWFIAGSIAAQVKVQYKCGEPDVISSCIAASLNVLNTGDSHVVLSDITVRYFFSKEGSAALDFYSDYAAVGSENVKLSYVAESCLEIAFTGGAGSLDAGGSSGEIKIRINKTDWSVFDQSDDFSFKPVMDYTDNPQMAVFYKGLLVYGQEYVPLTPSPSPEPFPTSGLDSCTLRFLELWNELHDPENGYFSPEGAPYHSLETLICEVPDYGHESTSETYSYYVWLEAAYGGLTGIWDYLELAWDRTEAHIIPGAADQPGNGAYDSSSPATYAAEWELPELYPTELVFSGAGVGVDPISDALTATYGEGIYGMHWLLDCDNWYGYGNRGDGEGKPSFINTFQRGEQESVWETIPHPAWEEFNWGGPYGFLDLFAGEQDFSSQWKYTCTPSADARQIQAMFWAKQWADDQGYDISPLVEKSAKMGDFLRLSFFDKYFKTIAEDTNLSTTGSGYDSAHYLLSWYYSWGGGIDTEWAWRIGCSQVHFGCQNPVTAWVLSTQPDFYPRTPGAREDWAVSYSRQIEFLQWLQSREGLFAGGATNSWKGRYAPYPPGKSTFHSMAYDEEPVCHDPGSNTWFGWQAWAAERLAEAFYLNGNEEIGVMLDKWVNFVKDEIRLIGTDDFEIPRTLAWSGEPDPWTGTPSSGNELSVTIVAYDKDVGIAGCLARALCYYAAARHDEETQLLAKELLDRVWTYRDDKGVATPESRADYARFFEQGVYVPSGWSGVMANGESIEPGITFLDIRGKYRDDPMFPALERAYNRGEEPAFSYHRTWAQIDLALANLTYAQLFGYEATPTPQVSSTPGSPVPTPSSFPESTPDVTTSPEVPEVPTPSPIIGDSDVFFEYEAYESFVNGIFSTKIFVNTRNEVLAAFGIEILYKSNLLDLNINRGDTGVTHVAQHFNVITNDEITGEVIVGGFDPVGKGPSTAFELLTLNWIALAPGKMYLFLDVDNLVNENGETIGSLIGDLIEITIKEGLIGDADENGRVNITDALVTAQKFVGLPVPVFNPELADVNLDGAITIVDALLIARYVVGTLDYLPYRGEEESKPLGLSSGEEAFLSLSRKVLLDFFPGGI